MSRVLARASGGAIRLTEEFRRSGEGVIWRTEDPELLAKLYHDANADGQYRAKLEVMVKRPPHDPLIAAGHHSLAWPSDLLLDGNGRCLGFLMPAIRESVTLINVANPSLRKRHTGFNLRYLHQTARNVAAIFDAVHRRGHVVGDVKDVNVLVNRQALPALVDCDSFQVRSWWRQHLCPVGTPGYTPPEAIGMNFRQQRRSPKQDRFGLAILIHQLLLGDSPFSGRWQGADDPPDINQLILNGWHRYRWRSPIGQVPRHPPLRLLNRRLRRLLLKTLGKGLRKPRKRASAYAWFKALEAASARLLICETNPWHYYDAGNRRCPLCALAERSGSDPFPLPSDADADALRTAAAENNHRARALHRRDQIWLWLRRTLVLTALIAAGWYMYQEAPQWWQQLMTWWDQLYQEWTQ